MAKIDFREISEADVPAVCSLLAEGFPLRTVNYWQTAMARLATRPQIQGFPHYGYVLAHEGQLQGVLLLLTSRVGGELRSNVSSWYVRPAYRKYASLMSQRATRAKGPVYLNVSPAEATLPIIAVFGFKSYTGGTLLFDPRCLLKPGSDKVGAITLDQIGRFDEPARQVLRAHLGYGCSGLILDGAQGPMAALYRIKWLKHTIPAAQFVAGDPGRLVKSSGSLMRKLLSRGIPFAMIDAPAGVPQSLGVTPMPERERRYAMGGVTPAPGDLLETEIAIFGP